MAACDCLLAVAIAERDANGDAMLTWSYPSTSKAFDSAVVKRSGLHADKQVANEEACVWWRFLTTWVYTRTHFVGSSCEALPKTVAFSVSVQAKDFNPEKYASLTKIVTSTFETSGDPLRVLAGYLSVFTLGRFGAYTHESFDPREALAAAAVGELVRALGVEVMLVWAAVLLKKRVVVYCNRVGELLRVMRALPALAWHRQDWTILRPICTDDEDLAELSTAGVYCAGVLAQCKDRTDLYDVYVDVPGGNVSVCDGVKGEMGVTSVHKDVASFLVEGVKSGLSDVALVKGVSEKTGELLSKLHLLAGQEEDGLISLASLKEELPSQTLALFLFNAALAEGIANTEGLRAG